MCFKIILGMDLLIDGHISSFHPDQQERELFNPKNRMLQKLTQFNLQENIFLGTPKVRAWSIFTLSIQKWSKLANSESCPILRLLSEAKICNFRKFVKKWLCLSNSITNF